MDLGLWLKEHKIVEQAKAEGQQNRPSFGETRAGIPEKIIAWVNKRGLICRENVSNWLNDLERNLTDQINPDELESRKQEIQQTLRDAKISLDVEVSKQRNNIVAKQRAVREANLDYEQFRRESGLLRPPDYTGRKNSIYYILSFFILEIILNATSLMDANPFGLMGAIVQMGLICAVNVLIMGWCMGGLLRSVNHVRPLVKCIYAFLIVFAVLFVIGFNLTVGHFRDSMQAIIGDPGADILAVGSDTFLRFSEGVIAFDSFQSALLALLGFLFFCVSSWKWFDRDDRYPGYGRKHRLLEKKQGDYISQNKYALDELESVFDRYKEKLNDIVHCLEAKKTRLREHRIRGKRIISEFEINMRQYQLDLNELLGAYFDANRSTRTESEPAWFSEPCSIDPKILIPPSFKVPEETNLRSATDLAHKEITALQNLYEKSILKFPELEEAMDYNPDS